MSQKATSVIHLCGAHTGGEIVLDKTLLGQKITALFGGCAKLTAQTESGSTDVLTGHKIMSARVANLGFGTNHAVALMPSGALYSWGVGEYGELGLGSKVMATEQPTEIKLGGKVVDISCGEFHTLAIDDKGNAYSWGQNFDRQLGVYKKRRDQMTMYDNCYVEDIILTPRFLPFSVDHRVVKVSCGARFSCVITTSGDLWTWGAGECGQLGTGRCTRNEVAACCYRVKDQDKPSAAPSASVTGPKPLVDVTCGYAHVMALTSDGQVYSWGLNKQGQLGQGDDITRQLPVMLGAASFRNAVTSFQKENPAEADTILTSTAPNQYAITRIFAERHSSAAVDATGRLYTWGSGAYHRTMHSHTRVLKQPTLVHRLRRNETSNFALCDKASAVLVISKLASVYPLQGPMKSFSRLTMRGCGFYPSEDIVVKFARVGVAFVPPRSALGRFGGDGVVTCRPPKFSEEGEYEVSLALNGTDFLPETMRLTIFAEPSLLSITPTINDARTVLQESPDGLLNVQLTGLNLEPAHRPDVFVRFSINTPHDIATRTTDHAREVVVMGTVARRMLESAVADEDDEDNFDNEENSAYASQSTGTAQSERPKDEPLVEYTVSAAVSLSQIAGYTVTPDNVQGVCMMLKAAVSLNEQDFCAALPDYVVVHSFCPRLLQPCCSQMDMPVSALTVQGESFLLSQLVETRAVISIVNARSPLGADVPLPPVYTSFEKLCPLVCTNSEELSFEMPKLVDVMAEALFSTMEPPATGDNSSRAESIVSPAKGGSTASKSKSGSLAGRPSSPSLGDSKTLTLQQCITQVTGLLNGIGLVEATVSFRVLQGPEGTLENYRVGSALEGGGPTSLTDTQFVLNMYKPAPITVSPAFFRRRITGYCALPPTEAAGGDGAGDVDVPFGEDDDEEAQMVPETRPDSDNPPFTITSSCLMFRPQEAKAVFLDVGKGLKFVVDCALDAVTASRPSTPGARENPQTTSLTCKCPNMYWVAQEDLEDPELQPSASAAAEEPPANPAPDSFVTEYVKVALMLDGVTMPQNAMFNQLPIFDGLSGIEMAASSKGPQAVGASVSVTAHGIVNTGRCTVRLSGADISRHVSLTGTVNAEQHTITFSLPEAILDPVKADPVVRGKDKLFYIAISLDGDRYFDRSEEPVLHVK